ncbi:hypothetical protein HGO21_08255 [Acinetobacter sp. CUI P1]|nr:hypothetical protein [Acinetobacter sp. CUI P1]
MIYVSSSLSFSLSGINKYTIDNQTKLSKTLFGKNNTNSWINGQGCVYVLFDTALNEYIYVGESTRPSSPLSTILSGLNRIYHYGFAGTVHSVYAYFFTFGPIANFPILSSITPSKQRKYLMETIEAEVTLRIRTSKKNNFKWPRYQHEIHFHSDLSNDPDIQNEVNQVANTLGL